MSEISWLRPKTTRRYIHPPKAERMYTIWAEGKIIFGEINSCIDWRTYKKLDCSGLWLVHGENDEQFDFHNVENHIPADGTPIQTLTHRTGDLCVSLETFCDISRRPTCFIKMTLKNEGDKNVSEPMAFYLRSGREQELVFSTPDVYESYAPDVEVWKKARATWRLAEKGRQNVYLDDFVFLTCDNTIETTFEIKDGTIRFTAELEAGETKEMILSFGKGKAALFSYEQEKKKTVAFWARELSRLDLPKSIVKDEEKLNMVNNLVVHILQCFCYPTDRDYMLPRQGGMQRLVWPWECVPVLEALSRLGDFSDYVEPALSFYFDILQDPDGEIRPAGEGWANITASALAGFATYCINRSERFYNLYRDKAIAAFDWIKRVRASTPIVAPECYEGLFPPRRGCDWDQVFQAWMSTDIFNVEFLCVFADAAEKFGDERAAEVRAEAEDYKNYMKKYMAEFAKKYEGSDILRVPLCPSGDDEKLIKGFYPYFGFGRFTANQIVSDEDVDRILNYIKVEGIKGEKGLYGHMPYPDGNMHIWYTTNPDYDWFQTFKRLGRRAEAEDIVRCQIAYSMTDEYYMLERYADNDPPIMCPGAPMPAATEGS